jgi:hypothetical protein
MKALLIPADPSRSVELIEISGRDDLRPHVGGLSEPTQYDYDAIMYVSDTGRIDGQPMNVRATDYIRRDSEAARQGKMIGIDPSDGLYGEVVVVGNAQQGLRDVPDRLVERFGPTQDVSRGRIRDVLRDRNEDGMIRFPWSRNEKGPYVVQISDKEGVEYLSRAGMEEILAPTFDTIEKAAIFPVKRDAQHFAEIAGHQFDGNIAVVTESEAQAHGQQRQSHEDMRTVINLANQIEDKTPTERQAIDRVTQSLDWASDRSLNRSQDRGRGR